MKIKVGDLVRVRDNSRYPDSGHVVRVTRIWSEKCRSGIMVDVEPAGVCPTCGTVTPAYLRSRDSDWFEPVKEI